MKKVKVLQPFIMDNKAYKKCMIIEMEDEKINSFISHNLIELVEEHIEEVQTEEPKEEVVDYSKLKVAELKELLNERGIEIPKGAKKADLINLLSE